MWNLNNFTKLFIKKNAVCLRNVDNFFMPKEGSFCLYVQSMRRRYIVTSLIGWAHTQNDSSLNVKILGKYCTSLWLPPLNMMIPPFQATHTQHLPQTENSASHKHTQKHVIDRIQLWQESILGPMPEGWSERGRQSQSTNQQWLKTREKSSNTVCNEMGNH